MKLIEELYVAVSDTDHVMWSTVAPDEDLVWQRLGDYLQEWDEAEIRHRGWRVLKCQLSVEIGDK